jgi:hypothetical protein
MKLVTFETADNASRVGALIAGGEGVIERDHALSRVFGYTLFNDKLTNCSRAPGSA